MMEVIILFAMFYTIYGGLYFVREWKRFIKEINVDLHEGY